ncbi:rhomboid family intramembrane serine protease [Haloferula sp.]|uniref:rhomboid family intramembrane serine protease n=1 Tax=Haloferula sp. TaxID=2497595 RepID=UPI00329BD273
MASYDRDYAREGMRRAGPPPMPPVTKWLLILNVGIFLLDTFFFGSRIKLWGCFTVGSALAEFRIWEFITFQFIHDSVAHILFNSLGIFFIGPFVERWWGSSLFIRFYLLCGAAGALFYSLLAAIGLIRGPEPFNTPLVGASAGLFGLLVAVYVIAPQVRVRLLFPPIELSMKQLVTALMVISVAVIGGALLFPNFILFGNSGGEAGHLGGAIMGFVLMKFPWLIGQGKRERKILRPKEFRRQGAPKLRPRTEVDLQKDTEVDRILDKISKHGPDSLTDEEREMLIEASKKDS